MKSLILTAIVVFWGYDFQFTKAQLVNTEWALHNFNGYPVGVMIGTDTDNNIFATGHAGDFTKIITTKYDTAGNMIWEKFYQVQDLGAAATWLTIDPSGNVIVTGYTRTFSSNPVESGLLTLKYDTDGNLLWDKLIPGTWAFAVRSVVDQSGNIYVTGRDWQYTATYDFVTVKYSPDGTQLWLDTFDQNGGFHTPVSLELDRSGNLFVTGGGLSGGLITVMYDSSGVRQWVKEESGTAGQNIRVDNKGGIFITGSYYDVNTGTGNDMRLIKYDYSGNQVWENFYDFGNAEFGKLVNIDSQSNIYVTGFGAEPGGFYAGWIIAKFDTAGNILWYNRVKENQLWEEFPNFSLVGPQDEIYVTGNVGVNSGGTTYHGLETVRFNSDGSEGWAAGVDNYAGVGKGLALDADLNIYAVGQFYYSVIKYSQLIPTGVELASFTAAANSGNMVVLSWSTATETNNTGFEIERKSGDNNWQKIGFVEGNGTTTHKNAYTYSDKGLEAGTYSYRLKQLDYDGSYEYSSVVEISVNGVLTYDLSQNYPNPFNPATNIEYTIPQNGFVRLNVYNSLGQEVASLVNGIQSAGTNKVTFDASHFSSGVYYYRMQAGDVVKIRKMMLIK